MRTRSRANREYAVCTVYSTVCSTDDDDQGELQLFDSIMEDDYPVFSQDFPSRDRTKIKQKITNPKIKKNAFKGHGSSLDADPYDRRIPPRPPTGSGSSHRAVACVNWIWIGLAGRQQMHPGWLGMCGSRLDTRTTAPGLAEWLGSKDTTTGGPAVPSENRGRILTATSRGALFLFCPLPRRTMPWPSLHPAHCGFPSSETWVSRPKRV